jgi:hypothetical protein
LKSSSIDQCVFLNLLLWPLSEIEIESGNRSPHISPFLPGMFRSGNWAIEKSETTVNGCSCIKLFEPENRRVLYVDPSKNYSVVRYEFASTSTGSGIGKVVCNCFDFQFSKEGGFFPHKLVCSSEFLDARTDEVVGTLVNTTKVESLLFNDEVSPDRFVFEPSIGEIVVDHDTGESLVFGGGESDPDRPFNTLVEARAVLQRGKKMQKGEMAFWLPYCGTLIGGLGVGFFLFRKRNR